MATKKVRQKPTSNGHILKSWLPESLIASMRFESVEPTEVQVSIGEDEYILREADEGATSTYKDAKLRAVKFANEGDSLKVVGSEGDSETRSLLVSLCLFKVCKDNKEEMERVSQDEVKAMKPDIVRRLFDRIKLISQIEENQETEEAIESQISELQTKLERLRTSEDRSKNSQPDSTPSSV